MESQLEAVSTAHHGYSEVRLQCPRCGGWIGNLPDSNAEDSTLVCSNCYLKLSSEQGVWRSLLPERSAHFACLTNEDQYNSSTEGSGSSEYYLALPYRDLSGRDRQQWALRSRTFRHIMRHILPGIISKRDGQLRILDLGAGNGWLSYRFALAGHAPIAVDLRTNSRDGLGAAAHYKKHLTTLFPRFQAELDTLPFVDDDFDLVIYCASFHYSENYERTLAEALRCTRAGGMVLITDTPWYSKEADGQQLPSERREADIQCHGLVSDGLNSLEYLTDRRLQRMEASFGIRWEIHAPNHGVRRLMQPLLAKLHGTTDESEFRIYSTRAIK